MQAVRKNIKASIRPDPVIACGSCEQTFLITTVLTIVTCDRLITLVEASSIAQSLLRNALEKCATGHLLTAGTTVSPQPPLPGRCMTTYVDDVSSLKHY